KALNTSSDGDTSGLMMLIKYTQKALNYCKGIPLFYKEHGTIEETCSVYYKRSNNSDITVKTLGIHAKNDNPCKYAEWHRNFCIPKVEKALSCTDYDVAEAIHRFYWLDFVCSNASQGTWYEFKNNRWRESVAGVSLKLKIVQEFLRNYEEERAILSRKIAESSDENFKLAAESINKKICKLISQLKSNSRNASIMNFCRAL